MTSVPHRFDLRCGWLAGAHDGMVVFPPLTYFTRAFAIPLSRRSSHQPGASVANMWILINLRADYYLPAFQPARFGGRQRSCQCGTATSGWKNVGLATLNLARRCSMAM